jgi:Uma2 family endonuclease
MIPAVAISSLRRQLGRPATLQDLEALPPELKGEIIEGELYVQPRPRARHSRVETTVASALHGPYDLGQGGPGGWWILVEPGFEAPGSPEISPDVAGWKRTRLPNLPTAASIQVVPDWICEVLSPGTRGYDVLKKRPFYARIGVPWLWYVDVEARTVTVSSLANGAWVENAVHGEGERVRLDPFPEIELDLASWWLGDGDPEAGNTP